MCLVSGEITGHSVCLSASVLLDTLRFNTAAGQTSQQQQQSKQHTDLESKQGHGGAFLNSEALERCYGDIRTVQSLLFRKSGAVYCHRKGNKLELEVLTEDIKRCSSPSVSYGWTFLNTKILQKVQYSPGEREKWTFEKEVNDPQV